MKIFIMKYLDQQQELQLNDLEKSTELRNSVLFCYFWGRAVESNETSSDDNCSLFNNYVSPSDNYRGLFNNYRDSFNNNSGSFDNHSFPEKICDNKSSVTTVRDAAFTLFFQCRCIACWQSKLP